MSEALLIDVMGQIDDKYIDEAETGYHSTYKMGYTAAVIAACLVLVAGGMFLYQKMGETGIRRNELSVSAAELGMEEYLFGITLPEIVYADSEIAIVYDYRGIYVYSFLEEELVGFADFRPVDMTCINGEYATIVEASNDGRYVRAYSMPAIDHPQRSFLYDVAKNEFTEVTAYDDAEFKRYVPDDVTSKESVTDYGLTYRLEDDTLIGVALEVKEDPDYLYRYKDLHIIRQKDNDVKKYYIFE